MKTSVVLASILLASAAWAGKFEIVGEGTAKKAAEFVRINIYVESECHSSALSARQDVDGLTQKAISTLAKYKTSIPEQLSVSPQANIQKIKTAYIDQVNVVICDENHSWTSGTVIQFKLNNLQLLAELQDSLLSLNTKALPMSAVNQERLVLSLAQPTPGVLAETWDAMNDLALKRAHQNALRQVTVLSEGMNNAKVELLRVSPTVNLLGQIIYDRVDAEGDTSAATLGTVSLKLARQFIFKVDSQP